MRTLAACVMCILALASQAKEPPNANIDSAAYLRLASEAIAHREGRRLSEEEFIQLVQKPGVVILDARSPAKFAALHVKGAVNLDFSDITIDSLNALVPDKNATILIYCNNNFSDAPDPMPSKLIAAALNLSTYTSLYTYGYRNVYELGPNLSVKTTRIPFEGTWWNR
jgi:hypothetical protein